MTHNQNSTIKNKSSFDKAKFVNSRKRRVCLVLNIAPLYRKAILNELDTDTDIDFYFVAGDFSPEIGSLYDIRNLSGYKGTLKNRYSKNKLVWQKGWFKLLFGHYDAYILTGNPGIKSNWLLMILARLFKKRVYLWSHGIYGNETKRELFINNIYMRLASGLFLYGNRARNILEKAGYKKSKISVIYNSLDYNKMVSLRDKYSDRAFLRNYFGSDNGTITFLGRLTPQKSIHLLLEAVAILKLQTVDVNIVFLGDGECLEPLKALSAELGIDDRVWFYGDCYDEAMIATVLQNSFLTVSPGNVGLTAIHSLCYGTPVVTHNLAKEQMPEVEAIHDKYTGSFFKYGDSLSLAEQIEAWLKIMAQPTKQALVKKYSYHTLDTRYNPKYQKMVIKKRLIGDIFKP